MYYLVIGLLQILPLALAVPHKHEYKLSFRDPLYFGTNRKTIPHFSTNGDALLADTYIRIVPSLPDRAGSIWSDRPIDFTDWEIHFSFNIHGKIHGGNGLAFWYTREKLGIGSLYGSQSSFDGLGIFFDSADFERNRMTPYIYSVFHPRLETAPNKAEFEKQSIGNCFRPFRNTENEVFVRITYYKKELAVSVDLKNKGQQYVDCFVKKVDLPTGYYFGLSAQTGHEHYDDHDITSLETWRIDPPPKLKTHNLDEEFKKKFGKEFNITNDLKKKLDDIDHDADDIHNHAHEYPGVHDIFNENSLQEIKRNQDRILDLLGYITEKLDGHAPSPGGSKDKNHASLSSKLEQLHLDTQYLIEVVEILKKDFHISKSSGSSAVVEKLSQALDHSLNEIHDRIDRGHSNIQESVESRLRENQGKEHHYFFYAVMFTLGGLIVYVISVIWRTSAPKKFI